jgi:hypothetical protein
MLGIRYHGTKIEANSRNSVLNHSGDRNLSKFPSKPFRRGEKCSEFRSMEKNRSKLWEFRSEACLVAGAGFIVKLIFFWTFSSVPSLGIDSSKPS